MSKTEKTITDIERRLWLEGADVYDELMSKDCRMVFPEPAGILPRDKVVAAIRSTPDWDDVDMTHVSVSEPVNGIALLTYRAKARHRGEPETLYEAFVSAMYVQEDGDWKIGLEQHTLLSPQD